MKIIDSIWITPLEMSGCIGVVITENDIGERKAYVGVGLGVNQGRDEKFIAENGGKLRIESARRIVELLGSEPAPVKE